jgi:pyridoxal phosphate enzyme (YggS family)
MSTWSEQHLTQTFRELQSKIATLAEKKSTQPQLLAVSKGQSAERIRTLVQLGQKRFGENYLQELIEKSEQLADQGIEWVFIGHLQSNKIKKLVEVCSEIQTVASLRHAEQIARHASDFGKTPFPVYIEVNAGEEESKSGVHWQEVLPLAQAITERLPALRLMGIMAIPPSDFQDASHSEVPPLYRDLRSLADQIGERRLSLGMSGDLALAIQAGSNLVRIGTALMGPRQT